MVYKKYVYKNGKKLGPYYYESYRDSRGDVKKRYLGCPDSSKTWVVLLLVAIILALIISAGFFESSRRKSLSKHLTGNVIISEGFLKGNLKILLKNGELLPADTRIIVEQQGNLVDVPLSEILSPNQNGNYFVENFQVSGGGSGFGFLGMKETRPRVYFTLIFREKEESDSEQPNSDVEEVIETEEVEEVEADAQEETAEEVIETEEVEEVVGDEPEVEEESSITGNIVTEETSPPMPPEEVPELSPVDSGLLTGNVVSEYVYEIQGSVVPGEEVSYNLNGNDVFVKEGSVYSDFESLSESVISLRTEGDSVIVSSDYSYTEEGFGDDYLGENLNELRISLDSLNFAVSTGTISARLVYSDSVFAEISQDIVSVEEQSEILTSPEENESIVIEENESVLEIIKEVSDIELRKNSEYILELGEYFLGADSYSASGDSNLNLEIEGSTLSVVPVQDFIGNSSFEIDAFAGDEEISQEVSVQVTDSSFSIETRKYKVVINRPVKWHKKVSGDLENASLEIPKEAENISVKSGIEAVEAEEIASEEVQVVESNKSALLTGFVSLELEFEQENWIVSLWKKITRVFTGNVVVDTEDVGSTITESDENKVVSIETESEEVLIEYETPGPVAVEEDLENGKRVTISDENELGYEDILAYAELNNEVSLEEQGSIKIYWVTSDSGERETVEFDAYDLDEDGMIDYVEWIVPHLSEQVYEIIFITQAVRLNSNREFVEDIYNYVGALDENYTIINAGEYVRVTFEQMLDNTKDITIYAHASGGVEIYTENGNDVIASFGSLVEGKNRVILTGLQGEEDVFDLKFLSETEVDWIVDPSSIGSLSVCDVETDICISEGYANADYDLLGFNANPTIEAEASCWYSFDDGVTNSTPILNPNSGVSGDYGGGNLFYGLTFAEGEIPPSEGENTATVYCNDTLGVIGSNTVTFTYDSVAPTIDIPEAAYGVCTAENVCTGTAGGYVNASYDRLEFVLDASIVGGLCWYSLDGGSTNSVPELNYLEDNGGFPVYYLTFSGIYLSEGANSITIYCNDSVGNIGSNSELSSVTYDATAPSGGIYRINFLNDADWYQGTATTNFSDGLAIALDALETIDLCRYSLDGGNTYTEWFDCNSDADGDSPTGFRVYFYYPDITPSEGLNTIYVQMNDSAGNVGTIYTGMGAGAGSPATFIYDTNAPEVTINTPLTAGAGGYYNATSLVVDYSFSETPEHCYYGFDSSDEQSLWGGCDPQNIGWNEFTCGDSLTSTLISALPATANDVAFAIKAVDAAGNSGTTMKCDAVEGNERGFFWDTVAPVLTGVNYFCGMSHPESATCTETLFSDGSYTRFNEFSIISGFGGELGRNFWVEYVSGPNAGRIDNAFATIDDNGFAGIFYDCNSYCGDGISEGEHTVTFYTDDTAGNAGSYGPFNFIYDRTEPEVDYSTGTSADGSIVYRDLFVNVSLTESSLANITFNLYNSSVSLVNSTTYETAVTSINWTGLQAGEYSYNVSVLDLAGNLNSTSTRTATIYLSQSNITLYNGWNLISLDPGNNLSSGSEFSAGSADGGDRNVSIVSGWNLIGYSATSAYSLESSLFVNSSGNRTTWTQAVSSGKIKPYAAYYNNSRYSYVSSSSLSMDDTSLRSGRGYWVYANEPGNLTFQDVGGSEADSTILWSSLKFTNGTSELNITSAYTAGWLADANLQYYGEDEFGDPDFVYISDDSTPIPSWEGIFLKTNRTGITLIRRN